MLTLCRLEIEGFGPYYERAELEFAREGVTVVYGDNMVGKTNLMNAIRFAFFGEIHGRSQHVRGLLSACNRDLTGAGVYRFIVGLSVSYKGDDYDIVREVTPRIAVPQADDDLVVSESLRRGGAVLGPADRKSLLRAMLPKDVARFFLFDGELLDQYAELLLESEEGHRISEAIEQILGVPVLRDARDHLKVLASDARRAKAAEASKHQKTQALGNALQHANDIKNAHEEELDRARKKRDALLVERDEIEAEARRQEIYAVAVERLDTARADLKKARVTQDAQRAELKAAMAESWRTLLDGPLMAAKAAAAHAVNDAFALMQNALRAEAVKNGHCTTCDQDIPEPIRQRLAAMVPQDTTMPTDFSGITALARAAELDAFTRKDVGGEVRLIWDAVRAARLAEADAEGRIADANTVLDGRSPDELRQRKITLTEIGGKIQAANDAIRLHEEKIEEQEDAISRLSRRLAQAGTPELAAFEQRESLLNRTHAVFAAAVERYKAELRTRVEANATELFLQTTTEKVDYKRLRINEQYGLSIIHTDGREEDSRSAGAEQVVALALIGALQANAPLRGPIVMDTPFGRLDPKHTANVVATLPRMARQVVMFVQEGEIDRATVRDLLGANLKREYVLDKQTARRTAIVEAH
jgi:DNA sulfur modification protein DndD